MKRIPEPELMDEEEQVRAYAHADFEQPHEMFVGLLRDAFDESELAGHVLDLGCGPADITIRFARAHPRCRLHGVDAGERMLAYGRKAVEAAGLDRRIRLICGHLPEADLPRRAYDGVISNSLLHHLRDPLTLWRTIKRYAGPGAPVFVMDLMRPVSLEDAAALTTRYADGEPPVLRKDFYNSLLAAYSVDEVRSQLAETGLTHLRVEAVSDRHLTVAGRA